MTEIYWMKNDVDNDCKHCKVVYAIVRLLTIYVLNSNPWLLLCRKRWAKKVRPLHLKARIVYLHLENAWTNFYDFWHTSTVFYCEHIFRFQIHQIYHTQWRHLTKVQNLDFAFNIKCYKFRLSIRCSDLLNKMDSSNVSKDGQVETQRTP